LRRGVEIDDATEHYSALLSPELFHLLTTVRRWKPAAYETWVGDLLDRELLD
jgi:hypothetical protein